MKRFKSVFLIGIIVLMLVGCGTRTGEKVTNKTQGGKNGNQDISVDFETVEYSTDELTVQVPTSWILDDEFNPMAILQLTKEQPETQDVPYVITMNHGHDKMPKNMKKYIKDLEKEMLEQSEWGMLLGDIKVIDMPFGQVAYLETEMKIDQEFIDRALEEGVLTQEALEQLGGAEALIAVPKQKRMQLMFVKDGASLVITGSYNDMIYDEVKEIIMYMANTITIK